MQTIAVYTLAIKSPISLYTVKTTTILFDNTDNTYK